MDGKDRQLGKDVQINGINFSSEQYKKLVKIIDQNSNGQIDEDNQQEQALFTRFFDIDTDGQVNDTEKKRSLAFLDLLDMSTYDKEPSSEFPFEVKKGWDRSSVKDQQSLHKKPGFKINLSNYITKIRPDFENKTPRGYPKDFKWNSFDAFSSRDDSITLLESVLDKKNNGFTTSGITPERNAAKTLHELGHVVCKYFNLEESDEMKQAYAQDLKNMSPQDKETLEYFIQGSTPDKPTGAGLDETCAHSYASANSPQDVKAGFGKKDGNLFISNFPKTIQYLQDRQREPDETKILIDDLFYLNF